MVRLEPAQIVGWFLNHSLKTKFTSFMARELNIATGRLRFGDHFFFFLIELRFSVFFFLESMSYIF